jgi:hypothetical protein
MVMRTQSLTADNTVMVVEMTESTQNTYEEDSGRLLAQHKVTTTRQWEEELPPKVPTGEDNAE